MSNEFLIALALSAGFVIGAGNFFGLCVSAVKSRRRAKGWAKIQKDMEECLHHLSVGINAAGGDVTTLGTKLNELAELTSASIDHRVKATG